MLGNCTNLTRVELNDNNLTYLSGHLFKNNRNLEYLYLQNNRLKKLLKRLRKKIIYNCIQFELCRVELPGPCCVVFGTTAMFTAFRTLVSIT